MAKEKPGMLQVKTFADHHVITQPNPLRKVLLRVPESDLDDPVGRAEKALAGLSGEFKNWMTIEADRLSAAHAAILRDGFTDDTREELFRAAHDIKGDAATFGFPSAGAAAESLCRIIEHAPDLDRVPAELIAYHINAIQAIAIRRCRPCRLFRCKLGFGSFEFSGRELNESALLALRTLVLDVNFTARFEDLFVVAFC
jgi:hypothetical protein